MPGLALVTLTLERIEAVLRWILAYPLLTGQILLMLLVSWAGLGEELGAERLFWHEGLVEQLLTGLAVGMLYGVILLTVYILYRPTVATRWLRCPFGAPAGFAAKRAALTAVRWRRWWTTLFPSADREVRLLGRFLLVSLLGLLLVTLAGKGYAAYQSHNAHQKLVEEDQLRAKRVREGFVAQRDRALDVRDPAQEAFAQKAHDEVNVPAREWTYLKERGYLVWHTIGYLGSLALAWGLFAIDEGGFRPALRRRLLECPTWTPFGGRQSLGERIAAPPLSVPRWHRPLHGVASYLGVVATVVFTVMLCVAEWLNVNHEGTALASPVTFVSLMLILFTLSYGLLAFHLHVQRAVFGGAAVVLLVWNSTGYFTNADGFGWNNYKLQFPGLTAPAHEGDVNLRLWHSPAPEVEQQDVDLVYAATQLYAQNHLIPADAPLAALCKRWQEKHPGEKPRIVIVCTSGGGIRAAVWTGTVLRALDERDQDEPHRLRDHIRLFTGASGGMVGATLYVSDFEHVPPNGKPGFTADHIDALAADSLTRTAQSLVLRDMGKNTLLPPGAHAGWDRGQTLERMWELNAEGTCGLGLQGRYHPNGRPNPWKRTFTDLSEFERMGKRPSMIYSPLMVEDARRLLISNLDLSGLPAPTSLLDLSTAVGPHGRVARSAVEFHRLFPNRPLPDPQAAQPPLDKQSADVSEEVRQIGRRLRSSANFKVVTAARMNATFPVISPAVSLPTSPPRRLVDAGIYDNYGVNLAAAWMLKNEAVLRMYTSGVALVQIRAFPLHDARNSFASLDPNTGRLLADPDRGDLLADTLAALSAPAEALLAARSNAAFFRNAEQIEVLHRVLNRRPDGTAPPPLNGTATDAELRDQFFTTVWLELRRPASLNWYLSSEEKKNVLNGMEDPEVKRAVDRLFLWFGTGGRVAPQ